LETENLIARNWLPVPLLQSERPLKLLALAAAVVPFLTTTASADFTYTTLDDPLAADVAAHGTIAYGISGNTIVGQ